MNLASGNDSCILTHFAELGDSSWDQVTLRRWRGRGRRWTGIRHICPKTSV